MRLLLFVLLLGVCYSEFRCAHDFLEEPKWNTARTRPLDTLMRSTEHLRDKGTIRIFADTRQLETDLKDKDPKIVDYLKSVISLATGVITSTVGVDRVVGNLKAMSLPCTSKWQTGVNSGKCQAVQQTDVMCGSFAVIPPEHLDRTEVCNTSAKSSCQVAVDGAGVPNADLIVYFVSKPSTTCSVSGAVAFAQFCSQDSSTDRPIAGFVNICEPMLRVVTDYGDVGHDALMLSHEIVHILGFSQTGYKWYRDDQGNPRSPRDDNGVPISLSTTTLKTTTIRNRTTTMLILPKMLQAARDHFGCSSLEGVELEDGGSSSVTAGSHWEKRTMMGDLMIADSSTLMPSLSPITTALLQDTGWYYIASTTYVRPLLYGRKAGCEFLQKSCMTPGDKPTPNFSPFCNEARKLGCTAGRGGIGYCGISTYSAALPLANQYFTSNTLMGGSDLLVEYCPYSMPFLNRFCHSKLGMNRTSNIWGYSYGPTAICYDVTLASGGLTELASATSDCYLTQCSTNSDGSYKLMVFGGGVWNECPANGKIPFPGYEGTLKCPSDVELPLVCQLATPLFPTLVPAQTTVGQVTTARSGATTARVGTTAAATTRDPQATCAQNRYGPNCLTLCIASTTCSGSGTCHPTSGRCVCSVGFFGDDCSVQKTPLKQSLTTVATTGGSIEIDVFRVTISSGSLASSTQVSANIFDDSVVTPPTGMYGSSNLLHLAPNGLTLAAAASLSATFTPSDSVPQTNYKSGYQIYAMNDESGVWEVFTDNNVDVDNLIVSGSTKKFCRFAVFELGSARVTASTSVGTPSTVGSTQSPSGSDSGSGGGLNMAAVGGAVGAVLAIAGAIGGFIFMKRRSAAKEIEDAGLPLHAPQSQAATAPSPPLANKKPNLSITKPPPSAEGTPVKGSRWRMGSPLNTELPAVAMGQSPPLLESFIEADEELKISSKRPESHRKLQAERRPSFDGTPSRLISARRASMALTPLDVNVGTGSVNSVSKATPGMSRGSFDGTTPFLSATSEQSKTNASPPKGSLKNMSLDGTAPGVPRGKSLWLKLKAADVSAMKDDPSTATPSTGPTSSASPLPRRPSIMSIPALDGVSVASLSPMPRRLSISPSVAQLNLESSNKKPPLSSSPNGNDRLSPLHKRLASADGNRVSPLRHGSLMGLQQNSGRAASPLMRHFSSTGLPSPKDHDSTSTTVSRSKSNDAADLTSRSRQLSGSGEAIKEPVSRRASREDVGLSIPLGSSLISNKLQKLATRRMSFAAGSEDSLLSSRKASVIENLKSSGTPVVPSIKSRRASLFVGSSSPETSLSNSIPSTASVTSIRPTAISESDAQSGRSSPAPPSIASSSANPSGPKRSGSSLWSVVKAKTPALTTMNSAPTLTHPQPAPPAGPNAGSAARTGASLWKVVKEKGVEGKPPASAAAARAGGAASPSPMSKTGLKVSPMPQSLSPAPMRVIGDKLSPRHSVESSPRSNSSASPRRINTFNFAAENAEMVLTTPPGASAATTIGGAAASTPAKRSGSALWGVALAKMKDTPGK